MNGMNGESAIKVNLERELNLMNEVITMFSVALNSLEGEASLYKELVKCSSAFCELMKRHQKNLAELL